MLLCLAAIYSITLFNDWQVDIAVFRKQLNKRKKTAPAEKVRAVVCFLAGYTYSL